MPEPCPRAFLEAAGRCADAARAVVLAHHRTRVTVSEKADRSPVTEADRGAERAIRDVLRETLPDHGVVGEEHGAERADAEHVWVVDPIDGTQAFVLGIPVFTTLIGLARAGTPILGLVEQPVLGERWLGALGHPTTLDGATARVRPCPRLADASLCATTPAMFQGADRDAFERVAGACRSLRWGADGYAYGLLASGFVDLIVEADLDPYDYLAHVPVVEGAGGVLSDWEGRPVDLRAPASRVVAAGDAALHAQVIALLAARSR